MPSPLFHLLAGFSGALCAHGLQGLLAAGEMAHVNADPARLRQLAEARHPGAALALKVAAAPERLLSASLIGSGIFITLATFLWGHAFETAGLPHLFTAVAAVIASLTTELIAKSLAQRQPEKLAPLLAFPLSLLGFLGLPFFALTRRLGGRRTAVGRTELALILRERAPAGSQSVSGLFTVLRLNRLSVERAARPLHLLTGLPQNATLGALAGNREGHHTRLALFDEKGRPDGMLFNVKESFGLPADTPLAGLARRAPQIDQSTPLSAAIEAMRGAGAEFIFLTVGGRIESFTTQYDCSRLLLQELPQD